MIYKAVEESSPLVGSSNKRRLGFVMSSYPIEVLFLSPPDNPLMKNPPTIVFLHAFNLSLWITLSTVSFVFSSL